MVLAAGKARQLRPDTDQIPAALLKITDSVTMLDRTLGQLAEAGLTEVVIVTGHGSAAIADVEAGLERRHGLSLDLVHNDRAGEWGGAYSLWLAREYFGRGVLLVNGNALYPPGMPAELVRAAETDGHADVIIAADHAQLAARDTKVVLDPSGLMIRIGRDLDTADADGRFLGATLIKPVAAIVLADALEATWRRAPERCYEDGFQELADRGGAVIAAETNGAGFVHVTDQHDLQRARGLAGGF
jgi:choline kinase